MGWAYSSAEACPTCNPRVPLDVTQPKQARIQGTRTNLPSIPLGIRENKEGNPKKTLIVWDDITRPSADGGLDIRPFELEAKTLKMRHIAQILHGQETEWIWIAQQFIQDTSYRPIEEIVVHSRRHLVCT